MIVVSAGWGKSCATYKNITRTGGRASFDCTGPQFFRYGLYSLKGPDPPNGAEMITAAVSKKYKLLLIFPNRYVLALAFF